MPKDISANDPERTADGGRGRSADDEDGASATGIDDVGNGAGGGNALSYRLDRLAYFATEASRAGIPDGGTSLNFNAHQPFGGDERDQ